jgi:hypothetical protein|tara:strand:- start:551 stop:931 length:381 start_codon:yes stop_codon:yes gene_type:complete
MNTLKKSLIVMVMVLLPILMVAQERELSLREKLNSLTYTPAVKELARDRRRASLAGMFLGQRNRTVGYHPIISILPQGNVMTAGPVILSPDRRYARIGISYSNTSIGAVHTFNFSTGASQSFNERK